MTILAEQRGAAERLLALVLNSGAHLWHNRPGVDVAGTWHPATRANQHNGRRVAPGLFVPAAERLYGELLEIYRLDQELGARFASYAATQTEWRDLQVACAALMLVQPRAGAPVRDEDGSVAFFDDDYRAVGEAMLLRYPPAKTNASTGAAMTPKGVLRVGLLLEEPRIVALNRGAGFADPTGSKPP